MNRDDFATKYPAYMRPETAAELLEQSRQRRAAHVYEQMLRDVKFQGVLQRAHAEAQQARFA